MVPACSEQKRIYYSSFYTRNLCPLKESSQKKYWLPQLLGEEGISSRVFSLSFHFFEHYRSNCALQDNFSEISQEVSEIKFFSHTFHF